MRGFGKFPEKYFLKYKEKPVKIKPYDPNQKRIGDLYIKRLKTLLGKYQPKLMIRGSTAFKILGKGEVEVGIYPKSGDWKKVLEILTRRFGKPENLENEYARFNDVREETEVELIVLQGSQAKGDIKLHEHLIGHPEILKEYEKLKLKYSFSKREYMRQKNAFLENIVEELSDD